MRAWCFQGNIIQIYQLPGQRQQWSALHKRPVPENCRIRKMTLDFWESPQQARVELSLGSNIGNDLA